MGYYINTDSKGNQLPAKGKFNALIEDGATEVETTFNGGAKGGFKEDLVCIVSNGAFDAAGYAYNRDEYNVMSNPNDIRLKRWVTHPKAKELSGYKD